MGGLERDGTGQKAETRGDRDPKTSRDKSLEVKRPKPHTQRGERGRGGGLRLEDLLERKECTYRKRRPQGREGLR